MKFIKGARLLATLYDFVRVNILLENLQHPRMTAAPQPQHHQSTE